MSSAAPSVKILIADAQPLFRAGLRRALEAEPDLGVVGETGDGDEAVKLAQSLSPDLLLLDPQMPRSDGLEALGRLNGLEEKLSTILLTAELDRDRLVEAVRLGVRGVVSKDASRELLLKAVRSVLAGQYWLGREEVADVVRSLLRTSPDLNGRNGRTPTLPLTPREREVVSAVVQGLSNREIAGRLSVSEDTVKHHLTNIYDKLGLSSRVELVVYALSHGLTAEA
jgi:DNA-binding NarL/FixJ family response regulator